MKIIYIVAILIVFAWPLNYLYQRQLGSISFLLLAVFFMAITVRQVKTMKRQGGNELAAGKKEKLKRKQ